MSPFLQVYADEVATPAPIVDATPTTEPIATVSDTPTPTLEASPTVTPSDTPTPTETPASQPTKIPSPTPTIKPTLTPTPEITATPSPVPTSEATESANLSAVIIQDLTPDSILALDLGPANEISSATVTTDKPDYSPTGTAIISGNSFIPNTTYMLLISSTDPPAVNFQTSITTNNSGSFIYSYQLDGTYRPNYEVEIKNSDGIIVASTTFTDAAKAWTGATNTDWATATNWSPSGVPASGDDVTIPSSATITRWPNLASSTTINSLTINGRTSTGSTRGGSLTINTNGVMLTIAGNLTINGATGTTNTENALVGITLTGTNSSVSVGGNISASNATTTNQPQITLGTGTLSITGSLTLGSTVNFTVSSGTVNYTGAAQTVKATAYGNLIFSGTLAKSMAVGTSVTGNLSIAPTGNATASIGTGLNLPVGTLTVGGIGTINGTWGYGPSTPPTYKDITHFANTTGYLTVGTNTRGSQSTLTVTAPASVTYGGATGTITTSGGSGTGTMSYSYGASTGCTVNSSTGVITVTNASNICTVTATKAADGNYNSATSTGFSVTLAKATPTATLAVSNSPRPYTGSAQSATVGISVSSVPGSVTNVKYDGSSTVPTNTGTYAVTADFVPTDSTNYITLTSAAAGNFVINKIAASASVSNTPQNYTGSAQSATVTCLGGGASSNISTGGSATQTNAGTYAVTADCASSTSYNAGTSVAAGNFIINLANQTITFNALSDKTYGDANFGISATNDSNLTVSFASQTTGVCTVSGTTVHIVSAGTCTIRASQAGNSNYNAASNVDMSFTVNPLAVVLSGSRSYDGTTGAAFGILSVSNKVGSDDVAMVSGNGTLASASVGSRAITSFGTLALGGTTAGNYTFTGGSGLVTISTATMTGSVAITGTAKFGQELTAVPSLTYAGTPTYQWKRAGTPIGSAIASTYTLVLADITTVITVTATADGTVGTGSITSSGTAAVAKADGPSVPSAPTLSSKTATNIILAANALNEFSKNAGVNWQASNVFGGLTSSTGYTFVQRVAETTTTNASTASLGTDITTDNVAPTFDAISNQSVNENSSLQTMSVTNVSPGPANESGQTVSVSATSSDPTIVPNPGVSGSGSTRSLTYTPATNKYGIVTITVTANDGQSNNNTYVRTFTITVNQDVTPPTTPGTPSTTTPTNSLDQTWSWTAATDFSGISNYLYRIAGSVPVALTSTGSNVASFVTHLGQGIWNFFVTAVDNAGNTGSESSGGSLTVDITAPTGTITFAGGAAYWVTNTSPTIDLTTDDASQYQLCSNAAVAGNNCTQVARAWAAYTATPTAYGFGSDGSKTLYVQFKDASGNISATYSDSITIDTQAPTVTVEQKIGQADPASASPINFTVTFSEGTSGFATGNVSFTGSTVPGTLIGAVTGGPSIYNVAVTGMIGSGTVIASVAAGVSHDAAGNANLISTSSDNAVSYTAPYNISGTSDLANGSTVAIAVNGVLKVGKTGTVASGAWAITGVPIAVNDIVTVWNAGAATADLSTAVTKQAGSEGNITGMVLNRHVLSIGSSTNQSLTLANLGLYDYDNNTDVMHSANASILTVDAGSSFSDEKINILSGNTLTIGTTESLATFSLEINGILISSGNATYNVIGSLTNNGAFTVGTSTVNYIGSAQAILPITYNNLTINQSSGNATLDASATVNGVLTLTSGNLMVMDPNTLTMGAAATTVGARDVTGIVRRTSFVANTPYSFGNQFTTVRFTSGGTMPTVFSVKISIGLAPSWKTDAIQRYYDIIQTGGSGNTVTLQLHYLDGELNGNTESSLDIFDYHEGVSKIDDHGNANQDITNNWVAVSGRNATYFLTSFGTHFWTLATTSNTPFTWLGSASSDWTDLNNWSGGIIPISTSDVVIPDAASTINDPILPASTTIKTLTIQSGGILNGGTGTLTIAGTSGALRNEGGTISPGTSTIVFTGSSATIAGTNDLYNLTVNSGADLVPQTDSTMRIGGTITNNGTWDADDLVNTVEYNGGSQTVLSTNGATPGYYNLILSGSGTKSVAGGTTVDGNLSISGTAKANVVTDTNVSVGSLTLGGVNKAPGTWGSASSSAAHKDNTYFIATTGILTVATGNLTPPTAPGTPSTTTPTKLTSQTWSWSAATDAISGIAQYVWRVFNGTSDVENGTVAGNVLSAVSHQLQGVWTFFVSAVNNADNQGSESSALVTVDTTAPTVIGTITEDPAAAGTIHASLTFNEDMDQSVAPTVTIDTFGAAQTLTVTGSYSNATHWTGTATVASGNANGTATLKVIGAKDLAGNTMTANNSVDTFTIDTNGPTFAIVNGTESGPVKTDTINVTVNDVIGPVTSMFYGFSSDATCNGSDTIDQIFASGVNFYIAGDHTNYLCVKAADNAGNSSYETVGRLNTDNTAPIISSITSNAISVGTLKIGNTITFTLTTELLESGAAVAGSYNGHVLTWTSGAGNTFTTTYTVTQDDPDQTSALQISGVTVTDVSGNQSGTGSGTDVAKEIDANVPTLVSAQTSTTTTIDVTFSEDLDGDIVNSMGTDFTVNGFTISHASEVTSGVIRLTLSSAMATNQTPTVNLVGSIKDLAGNAAPLVSGIVATDGVSPILNAVSITSDNGNSFFAKVGDTVTLTFTSSENINTPTVSISDHSVTPTGGPTSWTAAYTLVSDDTEGTVPFSIAFSDTSENLGTTVTSVTNASSVTFDKTPPGVPGIPSTTTPTNSITQTWSWSAVTDSVSGIAQYVWRVFNGTSYVENGTVAGDVLSAVSHQLQGVWTFFVSAVNNAGNQGSESSASVTVDTTAPIPGNSGTITTASVGTTGLTLNWTKSSDNVSAQANIVYRVYKSSDNNIDTVANAETNGTALNAYTVDISTLNVTGLSPSTTYYFNVIAKDETGNKAIYVTENQATIADTYTVIFNSQGGSAVSAITDVASGATVTLPTAPTKTGYTFASWNTQVDGNGTAFTASTPVVANITVYAKWTINSYTLTFDSAGGSEVSAITQNYETVVTAPSNPTKTGYTFSAWLPLVPATMPALSQTLTAQWNINSYNLSINANGGTMGGTVAGSKNYNTAISITQTPPAGYTFAGWTGGSCSETGTCDFNMPASNATVNATYTANNNTITFNGNTNTGGSTATQTLATNATASLTSNVFTKTGYTFAGWATTAGGAIAYADTDSYTMGTASVTLYAKWTINTFTLTYTAGSHGSISGISPQTVNYNASGVLVTATPATGYHFVSWSDEVLTASRTDANVQSNISATASFAINTYALVASSGANGSVTPSGVTTKDYGTSQTYTITPVANYHVLDVLVDSLSVGAITSYTFTNVTATHTISASFAIDTYILTVNSTGTGSGSVGGGGTYDYGTVATLTNTPDASSNFSGWGGNADCNDGSVTVSSSKTCTATFTLKTFTLTYAAGANGSLTGSLSQTVNSGAGGTTVTAVPADGYHFTTWSDGVLTASRADTNILGNISVTASFADTTAPVSTATAGGYTYGTWNSSNVTVTFGCADSGSGCETTPNSNQYPYHCIDNDNTCTPNIATHDLLISGEGTWYVRYFSRDNAGNSETVQSVQVKIDKTAPTTTDNADGLWHNSNFTVNLTCDGTGSGIDVIYWTTDGTDPTASNYNGTGDQIFITDDGMYTVKYICKDVAGNIESVKSTAVNAVKLDKTNPTTPGTPSTASPTNSTTQNWSWTVATDAVSGIAQYLWSVVGGSSGSVLGTSTTTSLAEGIWNFLVKAVDNAGNQGSESSSSVTVDTTAPTVTKLGDNTANYVLSVGDKSLVFSEVLSNSSRTAVTNALADGADKTLTYAWSGATLTITASETTTFANDVVVNISDVAGNITSSALIVDSKLTSTQTTPDGSGDATANASTPNVVITDPNQDVTVTVTGSTEATIDVSAFISLVDGEQTGTLPKITIKSDVADVVIPDNTVVTGSSSWDGVIAAPTITTVTLPSGSTLGEAIEIGYAADKLTFDNAVRILFPNQAGKKVGYSRPGTPFTEITDTCAADNQVTGDDLGVDGNCKINVGLDLVVWTKHFTKFATYITQTTNSSGNSSSGGSSNSSASAPTCGNTKPASAPALLSAVSTGANQITLTWSKAANPVSYYLVTYGTGPGQQQYGNPNVGGPDTTSYTVSNLSGGASYYFKVRAGNGCAPGDFSNEISAVPSGGFISKPAIGFAPGVLGSEVNNILPEGASQKNHEVVKGAQIQPKSPVQSKSFLGMLMGAVSNFFGMILGLFFHRK